MYMVHDLKWKFKTWHKDGFAYSRADKLIIMYVCLLLTLLAITNADSINEQILYFTLTWKSNYFLYKAKIKIIAEL